MLPYTPWLMAEPVLFTVATVVFVLLFRRLTGRKELWSPLAIALGAYIGARIAYTLIFHKDLLFFVTITKMGMVSYGGIIGALIAVYLISRHARRLFEKEADAAMVAGSLAYAIGRVGCFLDGHVPGKETALPWCVEKAGICRHPAGLYEALALFAIFVFLWMIRKNASPGTLAAWFLLLYGAGRFLIEFVINYPTYAGLTVAQWVSLLFIVAGSAWLLSTLSRNTRAR